MTVWGQLTGTTFQHYHTDQQIMVAQKDVDVDWQCCIMQKYTLKYVSRDILCQSTLGAEVASLEKALSIAVWQQ